MQYSALNNKLMWEDNKSAQAAWLEANKILTKGAVADGSLGYNIWTYPEGQQLIGSNGRLNPNATLGRIESYRGQQYLVTPDDWEEVGTRTGFRHEYNASVAAGSDRGTFYMSLGYLNNEGITNKSDHERLTGRMNADYQALNWLKVGGSVSYSHYVNNYLNPDNNGKETSVGNIWAFTSQMAPVFPAYLRNVDGSIMHDANGFEIMDYGDGANAGKARPFIFNANPIQDNLLNTHKRDGNAFSLHAFADITLYKGLVLSIKGTTNIDERRTNIVYNPYYGQFVSDKGSVTVEHDRYYNYNVQQLLNYTTTIADMHNVGAMLGHEYYKVTNTYLWGSKKNMFSQDNQELNGAVIDSKGAGSYRAFYNIEGWFGRLMYDYDNRYYLNVSYRRDASSRFDPEYRWGAFWAASAAWNIHKEKFFNVKWVNELKLKASYGSQGNDVISNYLYTDRYNIVNSSDQIGVSFYGKGTRDITWEKQKNINAGVEFALFNHRITGNVDYWRRNTTDMLFSFGVAPSLGYSSYYANVGDMYNEGIELELGLGIVRTKKVQWDVNLNFSTLKNRVTKLHDDKKTSYYYDADGKRYDGYTSGSFFIAEDCPMYSWRLKEYAGVNEKGQALYWKNTYQMTDDLDANGNQQFDEDGNVIRKYVLDAKGDKILTGREAVTSWQDADYYITNKTTVPKFFGGFGTTLKAYGFDFSINCSYSLGGKSLDYTYMAFMTNPTSNHGGYNFHKDLLKAWTPENTGSDIPRFVFGDENYTSDRFLTSTDYLNIENINLGYTLPESWTRRQGLFESLRIYVAAENVCFFSARKGFDPRNTYDDPDKMNGTTYSPIRTISGGLTLTF